MLKTILIIGLFVFAGIALVLFLQNSRIPAELGVHAGQLAPLPASPNAVSSQTDRKNRQVAPLPFIGDLPQTRQILLQVIESYPGRVQLISATDTYIHCVFSTAWLRFRDDAEFFLDPESKVIHFRSASRSGFSDMGMNRRRYETLAALYQRAH
jgi:uncharacterized protein (DUF1499 family)